jgi:ribosomal protein L11 methyltransferase
MQWTEAKVIFDFNDKELAEELISDIFYQFDLKGVVIESSTPDPSADWAEDAPKTSDHDAVIGYFPENGQAESISESLKKELARLRKENGISTRLVFRSIAEQDWAEAWKAYFYPQKISKNIVVKPTWREYFASEGETILEIDPGMAFGTGTHPTTALCVNMLEKYLRPGDSVLDVGTGSGILMIAAAKLGAESITGTDSDETAVEIARNNLLLNNIAEKKFNLITGNLADAVEQKFDVLVANILSEVIVVLLDSIGKVLRKGGIFIGSGIVEKNTEKVVQKMRDTGFEIMEVRTEQEWVAVVGKLKIY